MKTISWFYKFIKTWSKFKPPIFYCYDWFSSKSLNVGRKKCKKEKTHKNFTSHSVSLLLWVKQTTCVVFIWMNLLLSIVKIHFRCTNTTLYESVPNFLFHLIEYEIMNDKKTIQKLHISLAFLGYLRLVIQISSSLDNLQSFNDSTVFFVFKI